MDLYRMMLDAAVDYKDDRPRRLVYQTYFETLGRYGTEDDGFTVYAQGGCAVRLTAPWRWGGLKEGAIGITGGTVGIRRTDYLPITFNCSAHIGPGRFLITSLSHCSCSGGPSTIGTEVERLVCTGQTYLINACRWRRGAEANGGENLKALNGFQGSAEVVRIGEKAFSGYPIRKQKGRATEHAKDTRNRRRCQML